MILLAVVSAILLGCFGAIVLYGPAASWCDPLRRIV